MAHDGNLWAITSYFNPCGYKRRLQNYRVFRQRLGAPLLAVELAYDNAEFQLQQGDAEILIQLRGQDVMWQKERLLSIALAAVPASCKKIAWLDCDVVFERSDWWQATSQALNEAYLVQLFDTV